MYLHEKNRDFVAPIEAITKKKSESGALKKMKKELEDKYFKTITQ